MGQNYSARRKTTSLALELNPPTMPILVKTIRSPALPENLNLSQVISKIPFSQMPRFLIDLNIGVLAGLDNTVTYARRWLGYTALG